MKISRRWRSGIGSRPVLRPAHQVVGVIVAILASCLMARAEATAHPTPQRIWISLQNSSLDYKPVDFDWLRLECSNRHFLDRIAPIRGKMAGIIIPVFDNGKTSYQTQVEPFTGRNSHGEEDEHYLKEFLADAQHDNQKVYLALDVLGWQKAISPQDSPPEHGIFDKEPSWRESRQNSVAPQVPEAYFASPFNDDVSSCLVRLASEIGTKFPEAAGIVLNIRLSNREILGFSDAARAAAIVDLGADPVDLNLFNRADDVNNKAIDTWRSWRLMRINLLMEKMKAAYLSAGHDKKVFVNGVADYYQREEFNDLRLSQNWHAWISSRLADGVFIEGRWLPRYMDARYLEDERERQAEVQMGTAVAQIIPVSNGFHLVGDTSFSKDWVFLNRRCANLNDLMIVARNDGDIEEAVHIGMGKMFASNLPLVTVGEIAPEWSLRDVNGKTVESMDNRGKVASIWILPVKQLQHIKDIETLLTSLSHHLQEEHTQAIVFLSRPETGTSQKVLNVMDQDGEVRSSFDTNFNDVVVDQAGFVRRIVNIRRLEDIRKAAEAYRDPKWPIKVGLPAPNFIMVDMWGRKLRLSDERGRRNLVLTFFPKCFTGQCATHLSSLEEQMKGYKANDTDVWAVSIDPPDVQIAFASSRNVSFPLIPDVGHNLCYLYDSMNELTKLANRRTFLIDKRGTIRYIWTNVNVETHGKDVLRKIEELEHTLS